MLSLIMKLNLKNLSQKLKEKQSKWKSNKFYYYYKDGCIEVANESIPHSPKAILK